MFTELTEFLENSLKLGVPGVDCIVLKDGDCLFRYHGGYTDPARKTPVLGDERYNVYSCSKPVTCTAAMTLYEQGGFGLDDLLSDYMPEFAEMQVQDETGTHRAVNPIRIRHLFTMSAGFSYDTNAPAFQTAREKTGGRCPTRETIRCLAAEPLVFEPGARWNYSLCHDVLAAFVEVASGQRFSDYVEQHVFRPLGMRHSTYHLPAEELPTVCEQYSGFDENHVAANCGKEILYYKFGPEYESGGAGMISTVSDYARFLEALRVGDTILRRETIELMERDWLDDDTRATYANPKYGYGLGMRVPLPGSKDTDFGWGGAAGAVAFGDRANGVSCFYAQHMLAGPPVLFDDLPAIVRRCLAK